MTKFGIRSKTILGGIALQFSLLLEDKCWCFLCPLHLAAWGHSEKKLRSSVRGTTAKQRHSEYMNATGCTPKHLAVVCLRFKVVS